MTKGRPILSDFGPESPNRRTVANLPGGVTEAKSTTYCAPVGPKGQMEKGPGSNSVNHGTAVCQGKH
jgi:hypothetical protein